MNILVFTKSTLPVTNYGGTQRVIWDQIAALHHLGHNITLIAGKGSYCEWAEVIEYQPELPLAQQIPEGIDVVHFHGRVEEIEQPYIRTQHGNSEHAVDANTVFVSKQHALNHGAEAFVHNGLNWDKYPTPDLTLTRRNYHFLGKAAWKVKNVRGAIRITKRAGEGLDVLGGHRLNFKMGFRLTLDQHVRFMGMVDDVQKSQIMQRSKGLVFPVTWHEPFGLAITESLFFGCPVFATPYGSLPELVTPNVGFLSNNESELVEALKDNQFAARVCHEYARDCFDSITMARRYVAMYERVISGETLNPSLNQVATQFRNLDYFK